MKALVIHPAHNSAGRHDVTGAFAPGARTFCRIYGLAGPTSFDNTLADSARERGFIRALDSAPHPLELLAYFGHGINNGLSSAGFSGRRDTQELATAIRNVAATNMTIMLYACSAANNFAGPLAEGVGGGCRVYAHTTAGHTYSNPYVKVFPENRWVIAPEDSLWRNWTLKLRQTRLWAVFPFLTHEQLREVLRMPIAQVDSFLGIAAGHRRTIPRPGAGARRRHATAACP